MLQEKSSKSYCLNYMQEDPNSLLSIALSASKKAARIVSDGFTKELSIETKTSYHDLLTEYDIKSEKAIISHILSNYKDHAILSEESLHESHKKDQIYWIIDPIDGTWNFAHKIPQFCISIAAARNRELLAGVIYVPLVNEVYTASKGSGAFLNGQRLYIKEPESLYHSCVSVKVLEHLDISRSFGIIRRSGSTALDLAYVAASRISALVETYIQPWDVAAGALLVKEAGGVVSTFENNNLILDKKGSLLASSRKIHKELVKLINLAL